LLHYDIHSIAVALKLFFRELESPLLNFMFQAIGAIDSNDEKEQITLKLFSSLPKQNKAVLETLVSLLVAINENSEITKMGSSNLGIVFGPTLMKVNETDINACHQAGKAIEYIIEHHHLFFKINRRVSTLNPFSTKAEIVSIIPQVSLDDVEREDKQENSKSDQEDKKSDEIREKKRKDSKDNKSKIDIKDTEITNKDKPTEEKKINEKIVDVEKYQMDNKDKRSDEIKEKKRKDSKENKEKSDVETVNTDIKTDTKARNDSKEKIIKEKKIDIKEKKIMKE